MLSSYQNRVNLKSEKLKGMGTEEMYGTTPPCCDDAAPTIWPVNQLRYYLWSQTIPAGACHQVPRHDVNFSSYHSALHRVILSVASLYYFCMCHFIF